MAYDDLCVLKYNLFQEEVGDELVELLGVLEVQVVLPLRKPVVEWSGEKYAKRHVLLRETSLFSLLSEITCLNWC